MNGTSFDSFSNKGIQRELNNKQDKLTFDSEPSDGSNNPVTSRGIYVSLGRKQDTLTFDNSPTENSDNPVKSSGLYTALNNKADSVHNHSTDDITSGTLSVSRGGTGLSTITLGSYLVGDGTNSVSLKTPSQVLSDIGAAPSSHNHDTSNITSGTLGVSRGGTGRNTLTSGYYLVGNGTSSVTLKSPSQVQADLGIKSGSSYLKTFTTTITLSETTVETKERYYRMTKTIANESELLNVFRNAEYVNVTYSGTAYHTQGSGSVSISLSASTSTTSTSSIYIFSISNVSICNSFSDASAACSGTAFGRKWLKDWNSYDWCNVHGLSSGTVNNEIIRAALDPIENNFYVYSGTAGNAARADLTITVQYL